MVANLKDNFERLRDMHQLGDITDAEFAPFERLMSNESLKVYYTTDDMLRALAKDAGLTVMPQVHVATDWPRASNKPFYVLRKPLGSMPGLASQCANGHSRCTTSPHHTRAFGGACVRARSQRQMRPIRPC